MARRILSICPNSASVERLWSVFGTILTRLRTQLGNKALLNLAELKLYLREEHLQARSVQTRLKRTFGTALEGNSEPSDLIAPPKAPPPNVGSHTTDEEPAPTADFFMAQDSDAPTMPCVADSIGPPSMHRIVQELMDAVDTDNDFDSDEPPKPSSDMLSIPIRDLFNFTESYWVEAYDKLAM